MSARRVPSRLTRIREPAVAGLFYPAEAGELAALVDRELSAAASAATEATPAPKAIIAPHAGYRYSGPVAASAYVRVAPRRDEVTRVVVLGPAHRVPVRGIAVDTAAGWRTPLGDVDVDRAAVNSLADLPGVVVDDEAHAFEHSIELQVPFLQRVLAPGWQLVPLAVGHASTAHVAGVIDRLWGGPETLVVISTDLSHYHEQARARELDRATAAAVVSRRAEAIDPPDACGAVPLRGLLAVAERRDLAVTLLDLRTSGDTSGDTRRVVGYGAFEVV